MITGHRVKITFQGRTLEGRVEMGSDDLCSLVLVFPGILGGYVMRMPLYLDDAHEYRELLGGELVQVEFVPVTAEHIAAHIAEILTVHQGADVLEMHLDASGILNAATAEADIRKLLTADENSRVKLFVEKRMVQ